MTAKVRAAAQGHDGVFRVRDLVKVLDIRTYAEGRRVRDVLRDMMRTGEAVRVDEGRYVYGKRPYRRTYLDVMWHLIRSHRAFSTNEIERLSGAARATVLEYLRALLAAGYLRQRVRGQWELIRDVGPERPGLSQSAQRGGQHEKG